MQDTLAWSLHMQCYVVRRLVKTFPGLFPGVSASQLKEAQDSLSSFVPPGTDSKPPSLSIRCSVASYAVRL